MFEGLSRRAPAWEAKVFRSPAMTPPPAAGLPSTPLRLPHAATRCGGLSGRGGPCCSTPFSEHQRAGRPATTPEATTRRLSRCHGQVDRIVLETATMNTVPTEVEQRVLEVVHALLPHVVAVQVLSAANPTPTGVLAGGTGCLVNLGERPCVLTARHVAVAWDRQGQGGRLGIMSGEGNPCDITSWEIIDEDEALDLATIAIPRSFDAHDIGKTFYRPESWPPARARRGEVAAFVGYPGLHREPSVRGLENRVTPFIDSVTSSSGRHFLMVDEEEERVVATFLQGLAPFGPTGGVSGAPVFINRDGRMMLTGVIYEGGETERATFFAAHADFVLPDGTFDRTLPR